MKWRRDGSRVFIRLELGDEVHPSLIEIAAKEQVAGGWLSGIGAATQVELGYYNLERKDYDRVQVGGDVEVASLLGSVGLVDGKPFVHLHAVVSDREGRTHGGHLFRAVTAATLEFGLFVADGPIERTPDEATGLNLWRV
ncbi:MAG TPA: PPC domain-containing DNA-binding protein [Thermoanaerobaculia bacterium]